MKGAGGTNGGIFEFLIGIIMFMVGMFIFMTNISVHNRFTMMTPMFRMGGSGGIALPTGILLVPFMFGIVLIFMNKYHKVGWTLVILSIGTILLNIIISLQFVFSPMNMFSIVMVLVLIFGGLGLFFRSLSEK